MASSFSRDQLSFRHSTRVGDFRSCHRLVGVVYRVQFYAIKPHGVISTAEYKVGAASFTARRLQRFLQALPSREMAGPTGEACLSNTGQGGPTLISV